MQANSGAVFKAIVMSVSLLAMAACSTGAADKDLAFDPTSNKAIVVFGWEGLDGWRGATVGMSFRGVDSAGALDKRNFYVSNGNGWEAMKSAEYYVVQVEPGSYVASSTVTSLGRGNNVTVFCLGTVGFDAPAGQVVYIGNFAAPKGIGAIKVAPPNMGAATEKLATYPKINQRLIPSPIRKADYPSPECKKDSER
ncbi:MAG: hypothetical protein V4559_13315 [Pseudomonadota bacterium]